MYPIPNQPVYHHSAYQEFTQYYESKNPAPIGIENNFSTITNQQFPQPNLNKPCESQVHLPPAKKNRKVSVKSSNVDTSNFSIEERLVAAVWVHERKRIKRSISQIKNEFRQRFGRDPPAKNTLLVWERKLFSSGSINDAPRPGRPINRRSHVDEVAASVQSAPTLSLRARASVLHVPHTTLRTILLKDLPHVTLKNKDSSLCKERRKQSMRGEKKQTEKKIKDKLPEHTPGARSSLIGAQSSHNCTGAAHYFIPQNFNPSCYTT